MNKTVASAVIATESQALERLTEHQLLDLQSEVVRELRYRVARGTTPRVTVTVIGCRDVNAGAVAVVNATGMPFHHARRMVSGNPWMRVPRHVADAIRNVLEPFGAVVECAPTIAPVDNSSSHREEPR